MLFKPELIEKILRGEKTQTRRPKMPNQMLIHNGWYTVLEGNRVKWRVGRTYALQPKMYQPGIGRRIRITAIRCEHLQDITDADARAEGFRYRDEFQAIWRGLYRGQYSWENNPLVWVLEFELVQE